MVRGPDPTTDYIVVTRADPYVVVSDSVLEEAAPRWMSVGDGIVTIHGRDGDVSYGLSHHDPYRRLWLGTRSG